MEDKSIDDNDNKIVIESTDLSEVKSGSKIIIEAEDLNSIDGTSTVYPHMSNDSSPAKKKYILPITPALLWQMALAGLIGGLSAWIISEYAFQVDRTDLTDYTQLLLRSSLFFSVIGGTSSAILSSVEGITGKVFQKIVAGAIIGLLIGFAGGALGGLSGQLVYGWLGGGQSESSIIQVFVRGFGWSVAGFFVGLGQGIGTGGGRKILNGLIGGSIGGLSGGLLFDLIGDLTGSGTFSRAVAIILMGVFIGLAIAVVQEMRKEAWLKVLEGPTLGKEYIIHSGRTGIGSSPKNDIVLVKDTEVAPFHAQVDIKSNGYHISELVSTSGIIINHSKRKQHHLKNNDIIQIGSYRLHYFEKSLSPGKLRTG